MASGSLAERHVPTKGALPFVDDLIPEEWGLCGDRRQPDLFEPGKRPARDRRVEHRFADSLAISEAYADADWWLDVYRQALPRLSAAVSIREDGWAQRGGIDRLLTSACGRVLRVDEKIRTRDWSDVLLEQWSDAARRTPGWVQKPLACDLIAYAIVPAGICYLMPVMPLQRAWRMHGREWIERFGTRRVPNLGYTSVGVPVPAGTLLRAIAEAMVVSFMPNCETE